MDLQNPAGPDQPEAVASEQIEMTEERQEFLSRLAGFGLGEATERLLEAGGLIPGDRRSPIPPAPLPNS